MYCMMHKSQRHHFDHLPTAAGHVRCGMPGAATYTPRLRCGTPCTAAITCHSARDSACAQHDSPPLHTPLFAAALRMPCHTRQVPLGVLCVARSCGTCPSPVPQRMAVPSQRCASPSQAALHDIPSWVWLPWLTLLLWGLLSPTEIFYAHFLKGITKAYPAALQYPLRTFFHELRESNLHNNAQAPEGAGPAASPSAATGPSTTPKPPAPAAAAPPAAAATGGGAQPTARPPAAEASGADPVADRHGIRKGTSDPTAAADTTPGSTCGTAAAPNADAVSSDPKPNPNSELSLTPSSAPNGTAHPDPSPHPVSDDANPSAPLSLTPNPGPAPSDTSASVAAAAPNATPASGSSVVPVSPPPSPVSAQAKPGDAGGSAGGGQPAGGSVKRIVRFVKEQLHSVTHQAHPQLVMELDWLLKDIGEHLKPKPLGACVRAGVRACVCVCARHDAACAHRLSVATLVTQSSFGLWPYDRRDAHHVPPLLCSWFELLCFAPKSLSCS